ncbi:MAG: TatD family hydrolase [Patescibacteria group bacterium]|nr:TatD family hydrolase [Patescibacteria group bacterium]
MLIDSHAHVHDGKFDEDRDAVIKRSIDGGLESIVTVGTNKKTSLEAIELADKYENIYATIGLHPLHLFEASNCEPEEQFVENFDYDKYLELAKDENVVAIGEVGLDYHHFGNGDNVEKIKREQRRVFIEFIKICNEVKKPIVVHCWDGYNELLEILEKHPLTLNLSLTGRGRKGVIHSYIGSWKSAQKFIDLGYKIGLNGIVTYGESYDKLIRNIDLVDVLIETDCPYLPPRPLPRENRCEPRDVRLVAKKIAEVKEVEVEEVIEQITKNTKELFDI